MLAATSCKQNRTTKMASNLDANSPSDGYSRFVNDNLEENNTDNQRTEHDFGEEDFPHRLGYTGSCSSLNSSGLSHSINARENIVEMLGPSEYTLHPNIHWLINYQEAAIFLEEGKNNEKFDSHPKCSEDLPAYALVHNQWYHLADVVSSLLLLALALVEKPAVWQQETYVHGPVELLCLLIVGGALTLKLRWIGWRALLHHKRTMIKCVTLVIMVIEVFVVIGRGESHERYTRALRPIFILDTQYCGGVRRFIRQILQCVPPILDMMGLLFFFVSIYAIFGFFLFSGDNKSEYFETLSTSFFSMFILLTAANFPDVMMETYDHSRWNALFFISYLCIVLYILMNLMLAVVNETFSKAESEKFKKLLFHKRQACKYAFRLLVPQHDSEHMSFKQFHGVFQYFSPMKRTLDVLLMFKHLDKNNSYKLKLEDFYEVFDVNMIKWHSQRLQGPWYQDLWHPLQVICQHANNLITTSYFKYFTLVAIVLNVLAMIARITEINGIADLALSEAALIFYAGWDSVLFLTLTFLEVIIKIAALGRGYFNSGWRIYEFLMAVLGVFGLLILCEYPNFTYVVVLRPLRIIRLFKTKKSYRNIFGTVVILSPLMWSAAVVMLIMYYVFAIIGMELFGDTVLINCCKNTSVESYYVYEKNGTKGYWYLNSFENVAMSIVTLFELTVVNNWFVVMNGYAAAKNRYSRAFFIFFYLCTMVVLTIVVANVLQAFRFRIQYKKNISKRDEELMLREELHISWSDVKRLVDDPELLNELRSQVPEGNASTFIGTRPRSREILQTRMYQKEIVAWIAEHRERRLPIIDDLSEIQE